MPGNLIKINPRDNVAVTLTSLVKGDVVNIKGDVITILTEVPAGHKVALTDIKKGEKIVKYGQAVGRAAEDIAIGSALHIFNMKEESLMDAPYRFNRKTSEEAAERLLMSKAYYSSTSIPRISAFKRTNGEIGLRNQLWIVSLSPEAEGKALEAKLWAESTVSIPDGVKLWKRLENGNDDTAEMVLSNLVKNPNAGAVIVIAESDEHLESFMDMVGDWKGIAYFTVDEEEKIRTAIRMAEGKIRGEKRTSVPMSEIRIGLKCSSSDSLSGITANPLAGMITDEIIAMGGTAVLSETSEVFGAERLILDRSENEEVFEKAADLFTSYKLHVRSAGREPYEKLSIENRRGGITTITERSLGGIQKSGSSPVSGVLRFYERLETPGLNLLPGPGTDEVSVQLQTAAGCQLIIYTTGDGQVPEIPMTMVVISTRKGIMDTHPETVDFNAGRLLREEATVVTESLMADIIQIASGEKMTKRELSGN